MLEQAVYAGRNHTISLAVALTLLCSAPAEAADVVRVPVSQSIDELVAAPDGGAWVAINHQLSDKPPLVGRANPDGSFRSVAVPGEARIWDSALGPDGLGWFNAGSAIARANAAGAVSPIAAPADTAEPLATGPDGTAWFMTRDGAVARLAPSGATTTGPPLVVDGCPDVFARAIERAADGAMWIANNCGLVRIAPDGSARLVELEGRATDFAADSAGGVWFASIFREGVGHVDAAGSVLLLKSRRFWSDVSVAPDGSAWFAGGRCLLMRATPTGVLSFTRAPIPADKLAFDPSGGLWLASPARLVHNEPAGACDDRPPKYTITPRPERVDRIGNGTISLAGLRRARGFRLRFTEPVTVEAFLVEPREEDPFTGAARIVTAQRGATVRIPVSAARLRAWAKRKRVDLELLVTARDREGNASDYEVGLRVTK